MTPEQLMKYAEHGAKNRLVEIHTELNELAQHFPAVVSAFTSQVKFAPKARPATAKPNGSVPHTSKPNGVVPVKRQSSLTRMVALERYLAAHPGATTPELATAMGVTSNRILVIAPRVAKGSRRGSGRTPMTWTLKPKKAS